MNQRDTELKRLDLEFNIGSIRNNIIKARKQLLEIEINREQVEESLAQNERKLLVFEDQLSKL